MKESKFPTTIVILLILGGLGFVLLSPQSRKGDSTPVMDTTDSNRSDGTTNVPTNDNVADKDMMADNESDSDEMRYFPYSKAALADANDHGRTLLFFHATWCPTCRAAERDITTNHERLPADVTILKTDFDTEAELKERYDITVQHTFVQVDADGNEITKWSGGAVQEIIEFVEAI